MLTTFLVGIALGSAAMAWLVDRLRRPLLLFVILQMVIGVSVLVSTPAIGSLPDTILRSFQHDLTWRQLTLREFMICFGIMIVPTFCSGGLFPLVARFMYARNPAQVGEAVGQVYFYNTVGGIIGSLLAGFLLVPRLGTEWTLLAGGLLSFALGAAMIPHSTRNAKAWLLAGGLEAACVLLLFMVPRWNVIVMNAGAYVYGMDLKGKDDLASAMAGSTLLYHEEDHTASIAVMEQEGSRFLRINGKTDGGTGDNETQVLLGVLPSIYARKMDAALVIGLGTGITAGTVADFKDYRHIDCVEISPAVINAAHFFNDTSGNPYASDRFDLFNLDGRTWLLARDKTYDVITSEPSNPWQTGNANLFTTDFFQIAKKRLAPGGVFCQWLPYYRMNGDHFLLILQSYKKVFRHVHVWVAYTDTLLIGSDEPLVIDHQALKERVGAEAVKAKLLASSIAGVSDLLSFFWLDDPAVTEICGQASRYNTDNNPVIEFSAPKYLRAPRRPDTFFLLLENSFKARLPITDERARYALDDSRIRDRARHFSAWNIPHDITKYMLQKNGVYTGWQ